MLQCLLLIDQRERERESDPADGNLFLCSFFCADHLFKVVFFNGRGTKIAAFLFWVLEVLSFLLRLLSLFFFAQKILHFFLSSSCSFERVLQKNWLAR